MNTASPAAADIDNLVADWARDRDVVGASAGIYADGDFVALTSTGVLDVDGPAPLTTASPMRIGSLTKTFTAVLVVALAERGALQLTDPVSLLLPNAPPQEVECQELVYEPR